MIEGKRGKQLPKLMDTHYTRQVTNTLATCLCEFIFKKENEERGMVGWGR